jgi:2-polyprenyl-3-methyl-5-hydroxy-6-metoxy-1,4-benzoquinol methylase
MTACVICGCTERTPFYTGRIREGRFGEVSAEECQIIECSGCGARTLESPQLEAKAFYQSDAYRQRVDGAADTASYFRNHDAEQLKHLEATGTGGLREKVIADVGCGAGSFLHCLEGMARKIVAIEPSETFRISLKERGYLTFAYAIDAIAELEGEVDIAVSFSVIEHVERPDQFLSEIRRLLRPGKGRLIISTPNAEDALLTILPADYPQFFYRRAHLWYWTADALKGLLLRTGFNDAVISPVQRFGLGNFMGWLRDRSPQGEHSLRVVTSAVDAVWKAELQRLGVCDYLFATARA